MFVISDSEDRTVTDSSSIPSVFSLISAYTCASSQTPCTLPINAAVLFVPVNDIGTSRFIHGTSDSF